MGSPVTRVMGFLSANFQLAAHFHSRRDGTDGQTDDGHQCIMPHPMGGRVHNNHVLLTPLLDPSCRSRAG